MIKGLQFKNDQIITKEKLCLLAATVVGVWVCVFSGVWVCVCVGDRRMVCVPPVGGFVRDRVRVCGKHFTG